MVLILPGDVTRDYGQLDLDAAEAVRQRWSCRIRPPSVLTRRGCDSIE